MSRESVLSAIPLPIGPGGRVEDTLKSSREVALVEEAALRSDRGDGRVGIAQEVAGMADPAAVDILDGREVEALFEIAAQCADRNAGDRGQFP